MCRKFSMGDCLLATLTLHAALFGLGIDRVDFLHVFHKVVKLHMNLSFWRVRADDPVFTYILFNKLPTTGNWSSGRHGLTRKIWAQRQGGSRGSC